MMNTFTLIHLVTLRQTFIQALRCRIRVFSLSDPLFVALLLLVFSSGIQAQSLSVGMPFPQFRSSFLTGAKVNIRSTTTTPASTTVTKVEFFLATFTGPGGSKTTVKLGEALTAPFSYTWTIPDGQVSYNELSLKVTNSTGATAVQGGTGYIRVDVYAPTTNSNKKYYVKEGAPAGGNGLSPGAPFATIQAAQDLVQPGDSVFVMAGNYPNTGTNDAVVIRRTGTAAHWIVFTNYQNDKPKVSFNGYQGFNLVPGAAYVKIQGFDVVGNNANVTLPQATTQPGSCDNPTGTVNPAFNGNGIAVNGRTGDISRPHHIVIANNSIHDCGGAGISSIEGDYVTAENNTVYNNSWYTIFGASGISFLNGWNYDANTDTPKMIIRNNVCYGNRLFVKWRNGTVCQGITDGNGIILDNNNNQFGTTNPNGAYNGKFLIENNVCYQNGGRGLNVNYTDNVTALNNTFYQNAASPEISSEFAMRYSAYVRIYNNIFYGRSNKAIGAPVNSPNLLQGNNLTFGGTDTPFFTGPQSLTGIDPRFVDAANGNFQLAITSPAINAGANGAGQYSQKDILGVARPQGSGVDIGAYESVITSLAITGVTLSGCTLLDPSRGTYSVSFTPQYAGQSSQPISFSVTNEMPVTTSAGPYTLRLYSDNTPITLVANQTGSPEAYYRYNWLAACQTGTSNFAITSVSLVNCELLGAGLRRITFNPQYSGVTGQPISFSVVNEMAATTSPGPYVLQLYTDNPRITLKASQQGTPGGASYGYDWLANCNAGARLGIEPTADLQVTLMGNPTATHQVRARVRGAAGQPLVIELISQQGRIIGQQRLEYSLTEQEVVVEASTLPGIYLLRVSTPTQIKTVKLLKK